jgi:hypothetical protein
MTRWLLRLEPLEERNLMTFFGGYSTVSELHSFMSNVASTHSSIAEVIDYGNSYAKNVGGVTTPGNDFIAGDDLLALRITNEAIPGPKPVFFMIAGLHAREITTPEVGMRWINHLTQNYGVNADVTWLVDHHQIVVALMANPDGHRHVVLGTLPKYNDGPWWWRKSGRPNTCSTWPGINGDSYGVDLNRNFSEHWGGVGSSGNHCSQTYRGSSAASEPETQGLQNLMLSLFPDQKGPNDSDPAPETTTGIMIDVHTFGGYVLWPWGHTSNPAPNSVGLGNIGNKFATYNGYLAGQSNQTLYATTGTSNSWAYGALGIPGYTIELDVPDFTPSYNTVTGAYNDVLPAFLYAAKIARTPYMTAKGPDALSVNALALGPGMRIIANVNDTQNGNQTIAAAEYYIDTPPWAPGAVARAMTATDGSFNSATEAVRGRALTAGLSQGQHIAFVRGRDSQGNWGPVSAVFFNVAAPIPGPGGTGVIGTGATAATVRAVPLRALPNESKLHEVPAVHSAPIVPVGIDSEPETSLTVARPVRNLAGAYMPTDGLETDLGEAVETGR